MNLQDYIISVSGHSACDGVGFGMNPPCQEMRPLESFGAFDSRVLYDQIYQFFDGQENGKFHLIGEFMLEPLSQCIDTVVDYCHNFGEQESADCQDQRIKDGFLWRSGWYPFAFDECDNRFLIMDFDPAPIGESGQIFLCDFRQPLGNWLASDLPSLLDSYYEKLVASEFVEDEWYSGRFAARVGENGCGG